MSLNERRDAGYDDAVKDMEANDRIPKRMTGDSEYAKGWNALVEEVEEEIQDKRPLTRNEKLQRMADAGMDTWEDYRGEK